uniref:Protein FAM177A1 n=1 Tax=Oryzias sinensis TaxID=183150 RepID=A0A8C7Z148_9TELE
MVELPHLTVVGRSGRCLRSIITMKTTKMADISLYLSSIHGGGAGAVQNQGKDFESVELGEMNDSAGPQPQREKAPRRVIHFSSGETMEEYSTDEEEEGGEPEKRDLLSSPVDHASKMTWGPYFWFHMWRAATSTISACDYLGERMASLFGITSAKYQYAIDEYYRIKKEREDEKEENRLSEEADRSVDQEEVVTNAQEEEAGARPGVSYQIENESRSAPKTITVPVIVTAT